MTTINASTITNSLLSSNQYSYTISKQGFTLNTDAETSSYSADKIHKKLRHLSYINLSDEVNTDMKKTIKDFVSEYNSLHSDYSKIGSDKINKYIKKFDELISDNSSELSELGITKSSSGKLEFKSSVLESADTDKIESLFGRKTDFMTKAIDYSKKIYNESRLCFNKPFTDDIVDTITTTSSVSSLAGSLPPLAVSSDTLTKSSYNLSNIDSVKSLISNFVTYYNNMINASKNVLDEDLANDPASTEATQITSIKNATASHSTELNNVGIQINSENGTLSIQTDADGTELLSNSPDDLNTLFGSSSDYMSAIKQNSEDFFKSIVLENPSDASINIYA